MNVHATLVLEVIAGNFAISKTCAKERGCPSHHEGEFLAVINEGSVRTHIGPAFSSPPESISRSENWRALRIRGPLPLCDAGILAPVLAVIANAGASVIVVSSFDTDTVLVQDVAFADVLQALQIAGHQVLQEYP